MTDSADYCATDFEFFIVESAGDGIFDGGLDGILGMSPYMQEAGRNPNPFITALYESGAIDEAVVTFLLTEEPEASSITFGGIPEGLVDGDTRTFDIVLDDWWTVDITGISYNGSSIKQSSVDKAIFDTGTSLIALPTDDFTTFANEMTAIGIPCDATACNRIEKCENFWPKMYPLEFTLSGQQFTLEPWQYAWNAK